MKYTISTDASLLEAIKIMDKNEKDFLFVTDKDGLVLGIMTEKDIRHALATGGVLEKQIAKWYRKDIVSLQEGSNVGLAIESFQKNKVTVLPILSADGKLRDVLSKQQLYSSLLSDKREKWGGDFCCVEENGTEYEIYSRPWGFYKTLAMNDYFQTKIISVYPNSRLSLQSHYKREEYWIVTHGTGMVQSGEEIIHVEKGSTVFIPKECKHRLINTDEKESLIVIEVQMGEYFGEDDIVRYEDIYGRV